MSSFSLYLNILRVRIISSTTLTFHSFQNIIFYILSFWVWMISKPDFNSPKFKYCINLFRLTTTYWKWIYQIILSVDLYSWFKTKSYPITKFDNSFKFFRFVPVWRRSSLSCYLMIKFDWCHGIRDNVFTGRSTRWRLLWWLMEGSDWSREVAWSEPTLGVPVDRARGPQLNN